VIPPPDGDMADYMRSLERLLAFKMRLILPGHGPMVGKPEAKVKEYIEHRQMRERQVLDALRRGKHTIGEITEMIYVEVPTPLHGIAEYSVQAHLTKLINEERVKKEGRRYLLLRGG
jgi:glyoxylase-like metal-dependent hydrolase (beta-lactamase superfamily II)